MGRKIWLAVLAALGISIAAEAAEFVRTTLTLCGGDDDVGVRLVSKSANVTVGEYMELGKTPGRTLPVFCVLDENGEAEMEGTSRIAAWTASRRSIGTSRSGGGNWIGS